MVIAGIIIYTYPDYGHIEFPDAEEIYGAGPDKFAGVLEGSTVGEVEKKVNAIRKTPGVINVSYAYMNYEDLE